MKKYETFEWKILVLDDSDVITKSDSIFGANVNDNDISNTDDAWITIG